MPVSLVVFGAIVAAGLIIMAMTRSQWADELNRLGKHQRRMLEKHHEEGEVNIFLIQRQGYLAKILALAGLEAKYDQMKVTWFCTAIGCGLVFGLAAYMLMP